MIGRVGLYARNDSGSVGACPRNLKFEIKNGRCPYFLKNGRCPYFLFLGLYARNSYAHKGLHYDMTRVNNARKR